MGGIDLLTRSSGHKHFKNESPKGQDKRGDVDKDPLVQGDPAFPVCIRRDVKEAPSLCAPASLFTSFMAAAAAAAGCDSLPSAAVSNNRKRPPTDFLCSDDIGPDR